MKKQSYQAGSSLIDMIISVAVMIALTAGVLAIARNYADGRIVAKESMTMSVAADAISRYLVKYGQNIVFGTVQGVLNPLAPTRDELIQIGVLPPSFPTQTTFGGQVNFSIRIDTSRHLMALACDPATIVGINARPSQYLAGRIASTLEGGVTTSENAKTTLNGDSFQNIPSDFSSEAMVCVIRTLPNPI